MSEMVQIGVPLAIVLGLIETIKLLAGKFRPTQTPCKHALAEEGRRRESQATEQHHALMLLMRDENKEVVGICLQISHSQEMIVAAMKRIETDRRQTPKG